MAIATRVIARWVGKFATIDNYNVGKVVTLLILL